MSAKRVLWFTRFAVTGRERLSRATSNLGPQNRKSSDQPESQIEYSRAGGCRRVQGAFVSGKDEVCSILY